MSAEMTCNKLPAGLGLEVSRHPLTMRHVVNLVVAMERLKGKSCQTALGTEFSEENFLSIMMEDVVEVINMPESRPSRPNQFSRTGQYQCSVADTQKKSLVVVHDSMELHAVTLQGGSSHRRVLLNMSTYVRPSANTEARPVALGIKGTSLYLSCHQDGDRPTLHLETLEDADSLTRINSESEMVRFLFYKRDSGVSNSTLMSAQFPNWFVSTAEEDSMPVEMCQRAANRHITFNFQRQS
ncbi:interleukin-1 beta [Nerophis lumbriciformis]|uniref:interleukin-1 beta n=1 Tax=Nerophis lumbriciformis TaxID=546530 RepID=UPI002AE04301|nr:interleukin-1 beta-like [Nerophis lumbriciformis]XP_061783663.1 interleukin-1 beta-like [Nerophis lumbriciformis]